MNGKYDYTTKKEKGFPVQKEERKFASSMEKTYESNARLYMLDFVNTRSAKVKFSREESIGSRILPF